MFKENEIITKVKPREAVMEAKTGTRDFSYNLLPFDLPAGKQTISFTLNDREGSQRFFMGMLPEQVHSKFKVDGVPVRFVYSRFVEEENGIPIELELRLHNSIARAWVTHKLIAAMRPLADVIVPNFLHDTQCWLEDKEHDNQKYRSYKVYSLRVQFDHETRRPELLISYDGTTRTTTASLQELSKMGGFRYDWVRRVTFRGGSYRYDRQPDAAKYHPEEVFPLLNKELEAWLHLRFTAIPNKKKHQQFRNEVKWFYGQFAKLPEFRQAIPHQDQFKKVNAADQFFLETNNDLLIFGEKHTGRDIYEGLRRHGPAKLPACQDVRFFFIYDRQQSEITDKFRDFLQNESAGENQLAQFTRVPMIPEPDLDIVFDSKEEPLQSILYRISLLELKAGQRYYAFFINPWSLYDQDAKNHLIYYRVKEALLRRNVMMQNMDAAKIKTGNLHYFLPNLAAAMIGKLGGTPWRLNRPHSNALVVGFGLFRSRKYNIRYVGSSVCFANDGTFEKFDCFKANDTYALAATVEKALYNYRAAHQKVERIVIHFYKKLSYKELKPVEKMLRQLGLGIPIVIVSINKSYSNNITAFLHSDGSGLPQAGSVFRYRPNQYLLYNNDRMPESTGYQGNMPMPVKISLWATEKTILENEETVRSLLQQVYDFCFLYYRAVKHAKLPVTILYPEMLAAIVPFFRDEMLQERSDGGMMFL